MRERTLEAAAWAPSPRHHDDGAGVGLEMGSRGAARPPDPATASSSGEPLALVNLAALQEFMTGASRSTTAMGDSSSTMPASGARGFEARDLYRRELKVHPERFLDEFRRLLAEELATDVSTLSPLALRDYFDRRVAFGSNRLLLQMGHLMGHLWALAERGEQEQLHTAIATAAVFVEQAAVQGGRTETAWQFTGLPEPPLQNPAVPKTARPAAALMPHRWLAANVAYMRDLEYLAGRIGSPAPTPRLNQPGGDAPPPKAPGDRPPTRAEKAAAAKAKAAAKAAAQPAA